MEQDMGASADADRAVVNGAASVSAVPASIPSAVRIGVTGRLGETLNEYGTPVVKYRCATCREVFSVCPSPSPEEDYQWTDCLGPECGSYDPARDVDKWFDEGRVRAIPDGEGRSRLVPFKVIGGGRADV